VGPAFRGAVGAGERPIRKAPAALALTYLPIVLPLDYVYRTYPEAIDPVELTDRERFPTPEAVAEYLNTWLR